MYNLVFFSLCIRFVSKFILVLFCSVFCGLPIPYPKREFISDDENDDKSAKVTISMFS